MKVLKCVSGLLVALSLFGYLASASAAIQLSGTRVIINEKDREASLPVKNEGKAPYVLQAWIDTGEGHNKTPFLVTPPLSRMDPGMENILRILRVSGDLPADRESVFWLNVKEIPEKVEEKNVLQLAVRSRIKLFYRPAALQDGDASEARKQLKWAVVASPDHQGARLKIINPTPYHVTFIGLSINKGKELIDPDMLPPRGELSLPLKIIKSPQGVSVSFTTVNDYGGETALESVSVPATEFPVLLQPEAVSVPSTK